MAELNHPQSSMVIHLRSALPGYFVICLVRFAHLIQLLKYKFKLLVLNYTGESLDVSKITVETIVIIIASVETRQGYNL